MNASEFLQNEQSTATENALRRAVDTTPAFIHTARPDGYLDYFNRGWLDFFGKSLEDVCGWRWTESVHPEDVAGIVQKWHAALASGEPFEAEARVRRADGTYRALLHRKVPLHDEPGNIVKWFGSSIDIRPTNFDLRCLVGLLNSRLVAFWLFHKGKLQGNQYQIDIVPLTRIPVRQVAGEAHADLTRLVDSILTAKRSDPRADVSTLEAEIDQIVYRLLRLTPEEIALIESSVPR